MPRHLSMTGHGWRRSRTAYCKHTEIAGRLRSSDNVDEVEAARAAGEEVSNTSVVRVWVIHPEACCRVQHTGCSRGFTPVRLQEYLDGWVYGVVRDVDDQPLLVGPVLRRRDTENVGDGDQGVDRQRSHAAGVDGRYRQRYRSGRRRSVEGYGRAGWPRRSH